MLHQSSGGTAGGREGRRRLVLTFRSTSTTGGTATTTTGMQELDDFVHGHGPTTSENETVAQWVADARALFANTTLVQVDKWYGRRVVVRFSDALSDTWPPSVQPSSLTILAWLRYGMPNLESVEEDALATISSSSSSYSSTESQNASSSSSLLLLLAAAASSYKINASDFPTAVLDGGIRPSALPLFSDMREGYDFISDPEVALDGDGRDADWIDPGDAVPGKCPAPSSSWHGTQTAAMLASIPMGLMPTTPLLPVRVLGACKTGYASDIADAIVWAAGGEIRGLSRSQQASSPRARIIVMPFAGFSDACPSYLQSAVSFAASRNVTLLAAAGNAGRGTQAAALFPGNCHGVISVGAHGDAGEYAAYSTSNADVYFAGGTPEHPLTCLVGEKDEKQVPCYGTSFSVVLATEWVVRSFMETLPLREQRLTYAFTIPTYRDVPRPSSDDDGASMNLTATGANDGGCASDFFLRRKDGTVCTPGSWQPCTAGSCRWGGRSLYDINGNAIAPAWNWPQNFYMDEWCACNPGTYASSSSFIYGNPKWYCNNDATPAGKCPWAPAAHDQITCTVCEAGWYCPGGAYFSGYAWGGDPNFNNCGDYEGSTRYWIGHRYRVRCNDCPAGTRVTRDCAGGATQGRTCETCLRGTYSPVSNSLSCTPCGKNTYQVNPGAAGCDPCPAGHTSNEGAWQCTPCPAGTREDNRVCVPCPTGEGSEPGSTQCKPCGPGYTLEQEGRCVACTTGKFKSSSGPAACDPCTAGKYADQLAMTACKDCSTGGATGNPRTSCTPCPAGNQPDDQKISCVPCSQGKYAPAAGTSPGCLDCPTGLVAAATGQTACALCGEGRFAVAPGASICRNCDDGRYWPSATQGTTECLRCPAGKYVLPAGLPPLYKMPTACTDCRYNEVSMAGSSSCSTCEPGQFIDKITKPAEWRCASCTPGSYALNGSVTCTACPAGTYSLARASGCTNCPAGSYSASPGSAACTQCPAGTYSNRSRATSAATCMPCVGQNFSAADGSTACLRCPADMPALAGHRGCGTSRCAAGWVPTWSAMETRARFRIGGVVQYSANGTNDLGCARCRDMYQQGFLENRYFYEASPGGECRLCSTCFGYLQTTVVPCREADDAQCGTCQECAIEGETWYSTRCADGVLSVCSPCRPRCRIEDGEYESRPCTLYEDRDCQPCDTSCAGADQYIVADCKNTSNLQCADCQVCQPGEYVKAPCGTRTARVCEVCPAGKFSTAVNANSCQSCGAGTYAPQAGSTYCEMCAVGNYASSSGATACLGCGVGSYAVVAGVSSCTSCAAGTFLESSVTGTCTPCPAGSYSTAEGSTTCARCLPGTFANATGLTACTACPTGTYSPSSPQGNSSSCAPCPAGNYTKVPGQSACAACAPGTFSAAPGAVQCLACAAGEYVESAGQTQCKVCAAGTYAMPQSSSCTACAEGTFATSEGSPNCTACAAPCVLGRTYESSACTRTANRVCSACDVVNNPCQQGFTSNVSWCPPTGIYECSPCPVYGSDNVEALSSYSCRTCTSRHCGETPGTYRASMCPSREFGYYSDYETFSCGTCRGCYYRHYVKTWSFCSGLGSQRFDLDPESPQYCAPCLAAAQCQVGQYVANLCTGRTTHDTETCVDCKSCPYGHYHAHMLNGSIHPDFYGKPWSKGYAEVRVFSFVLFAM